MSIQRFFVWRFGGWFFWFCVLVLGFFLTFPEGIPIIPFILLSFFFFFLVSQAAAIFRADSPKCFSSRSLNPFSVNMLYGCSNWRHVPYLLHGLQITKHSFTLSCILSFHICCWFGFFFLIISLWTVCSLCVCTHLCIYIKKKKNKTQVLWCQSFL